MLFIRRNKFKSQNFSQLFRTFVMLNVVFPRHKSLNNWNEISEETKKLLLKENVDFSSQSLSYREKKYCRL